MKAKVNIENGNKELRNMRTYYNEFDKKKCAALKQLMNDGHITKGYIDDRPIQEVTGADLQDYERCHFFAGIGLWDYALNLAGWPEDTPVWTGSCPCQPFSAAGRQKGKADDRHLWPEWQRLITECLPSTVFGEQVASAIAKGWLDDVYQGLETQGYAVGAAVLPSSAVGAPHRRERLWFVADSENIRLERGEDAERERAANEQVFKSSVRGESGRLGTLGGTEHDGRHESPTNRKTDRSQEESGMLQSERSDTPSTFWNNGEWLDCPDGKQRLVEPSIPLLVNGDSERVGLIHAAGDAIVPQVAAEFIQSYMELQT